ncbi:MAG: hypothetical protein JWP89_2628 [Schlesneria sp.]|nr:hypothetical protein [Schlesneria sp.]
MAHKTFTFLARPSKGKSNKALLQKQADMELAEKLSKYVNENHDKGINSYSPSKVADAICSSTEAVGDMFQANGGSKRGMEINFESSSKPIYKDPADSPSAPQSSPESERDGSSDGTAAIESDL